MSIEYRIAIEGDLLRVVATGTDDSLAEAQAYSLAVLQAAVEHGATRILSDERELAYRLGIIDTYALAQAIAERAPSVGRAALVTARENQPEAEFWETVVRNRGLVVRIFERLEDAEAWLGI